MISMELQRDVPQYMAIPWLMTWVMARTVSAGGRESSRRALGHRDGAGPCTSCKQCASKCQTGRSWVWKLKQKGMEIDPRERERDCVEMASPQ